MNLALTEAARKLRGDATDAEGRLWRALRNRQIGGSKFKRQVPFGPYVVDFICVEAKLIVEADGGQHAEQVEADEIRTMHFSAQGYRVLRFWNNEILQNLEGVLETIARELTKKTPSPQPSPQGERGQAAVVSPQEVRSLAVPSPSENKDSLRGLLALFALVLASFLLIATNAFAEPKFPPLTGRIVDEAHLLTPADKAAIEADLKGLEAKSSDQIVVYTTKSLQGYPIEDFGYQLGRAWGIGQKGTNNGVLLIVAPTEHKVRIEVGRGLEPQLTDLLSSMIIRNRILPEFKRGGFSAGIKAGVHDIKDVLLGDAEAVKERAGKRPAVASKGDGWAALIPILFIVGIFGFVFWAQAQQARQPLSGGRPGRPGYGPPIFFPGGWGGGGGHGGGGDGGGFSGGGGDFGGGGASGDW
jgi:uncharacterized protein